MRRILTIIVTALTMAFAGTAQAADFLFSGAFSPTTGSSQTMLLSNGSFDGYFTIAPTTFPGAGTTTITAFSFNLRDQSGTILKTLTKGSGGASGYISSAYAAIYGGTVINFQDTASDYLQLVVPTGFAGTGAVLANGYSYAQIAPQNQARVAAGAVTTLPETATWAMMLTGFGMIGAAIRRRSRGLTVSVA